MPNFARPHGRDARASIDFYAVTTRRVESCILNRPGVGTHVRAMVPILANSNSEQTANGEALSNATGSS